ncbi:hypothetical protein LLG46_05865 [bacterium]|nr:hypothetical protein [bacterium]
MRSVITMVLTLNMLVGAVICDAATYLDPMPFNNAISGFGFKKTFNLDSLVSGTTVTSCGMVSIGSNGLASDGETSLTLMPIATDDYSTYSSPISIGVSGSENQFLAGNSDRIIFTFSRPVHAFGLYLIGNPSPTGDPAIPFWKMHVSNSSGYDAYSATDPLTTLSEGNDAYFLGVVSTGDPFTQVNLYSDNDSAAVYSFNVDNITIAADVPVVTPVEAKSVASGDVVIPDVIVTRVHSDRFNVETSNRVAGMAVIGDGTSRDKAVSIFGTVQSTSDDERVIQLVQLISEEDSAAPAPLGIDGKYAGGASMGLQTGCVGSAGLNNIGLDVVVWGRVTAYDESIQHTWITVDDGSGRDSGMGSLGVKVEGPAIWGNGKYVGEIVRVQGSSSIFKVGSEHYPLIRVAEWSDIETLYYPPQ